LLEWENLVIQTRFFLLDKKSIIGMIIRSN
jgi:hypothetical protein